MSFKHRSQSIFQIMYSNLSVINLCRLQTSLRMRVLPSLTCYFVAKSVKDITDLLIRRLKFHFRFSTVTLPLSNYLATFSPNFKYAAYFQW